jgi:hypothetical protein
MMIFKQNRWRRHRHRFNAQRKDDSMSTTIVQQNGDMEKPNNGQQLATIEDQQTTVAELYGQDQDIAAFGYAVQKVAPWAKKMQAHDIGLVVRRAMALGVDPLNPHEVQIWTDKRGNVQFQLAYTLVAEWVRHFHGQHTEPQYEQLDEAAKDAESISHSALAFRVTFIMRDDIDLLKTLVESGFDPATARDMVTTTGLGVAFPKELESPYFAPAGRSPAWKVRKRALVDAYRRKFGTPTRDQLTELRRVSGRDQVNPEDWPDVEFGNGFEREQAAIVNATARESKERINDMTDEERQEVIENGQSVLHGFDEDGI